MILTAIILAVPNFINYDINEKLAYNQLERFHPALTSISSINELEHYIDTAAVSKNIIIGSPEYTQLVAYVISCRFYHGFSHWKLNENWIAAIGEKITGIGLSCKVQPGKIMLHPNAACSQQALVMMEILRRKKTDYRKVGFPHHYALEVRSNDKWYYFDPNMEPNMNLKQRLHENWNENNDSVKKYYDSTKHKNLSYQFGDGLKASFGPVNEVPAKRLHLFQSVTAVLSKILWCFPLLFLFIRHRREKLSEKPGSKVI